MAADESDETPPRTGVLLEGDVPSALRRMAVPMLLGMVAMILVNLVVDLIYGLINPRIRLQR